MKNKLINIPRRQSVTGTPAIRSQQHGFLQIPRKANKWFSKAREKGKKIVLLLRI